jgi:hypothetical protein
MKIVSIKRLVLLLILSFGSVLTLPAYAWPDTDEMNMCGAAAKNVRAYGGQFRGWAAHDNYIAQRGKGYYYRTNCPESKATKNYKGKNWTPGAKMRVKPKMHKKRMYKKRMHKKYKMHKKHNAHNPNHKNHADCIRVDAMNNSAIFIKKATRGLQANRLQTVDANFYRQAQAVLNTTKVKRTAKVHRKAHNPNHKNHADCIRVDGLNASNSSAVRVVRRIR